MTYIVRTKRDGATLSTTTVDTIEQARQKVLELMTDAATELGFNLEQGVELEMLLADGTLIEVVKS
jgi:hypothetical protein